ncbi:nucleoside triphosphate pyrophosphohydrolase [Oceanibaculum pacificum]|uniref:Nucleoside triphosphate pyrophosphohydrolase n=1 Tax=Oceanibaculum pacificum TaxID=580166 RepID=A0A154W8D4_9PROT|nr:nucleoside triphosphate pyrophosphohydrolase [Oceanibaculum pacificum]KZD09794.1 nucleoside triphosphate hydrolase [Oceanibaculum pacificum]
MTAPIDRLREIMARLRAPDGCPWDREQDFASIAPYTIEEAYEVDDAIRQGDMDQLREELGDLLLQVVFHAQMADEQGHFDFDAVATAIADKLVRRHPHVFTTAPAASSAQVKLSWEELKAEERALKAGAKGAAPSVLDDVGRALPALMRAEKLQKRAARVGFDWPETEQVIAKIEEELAEVKEELAARQRSAANIHEEMGDLLFAVTNLARHLKVDPELALRDCNAKFERRFQRIEALLAAEGRTPDQSGLDEMESLWLRAKAEEKLKKSA